MRLAEVQTSGDLAPLVPFVTSGFDSIVRVPRYFQLIDFQGRPRLRIPSH